MQVNVQRLTREPKPTTAPIGNLQLMRAVAALGRRHGVCIEARKLLGRGPKCRFQVSVADDSDIVDAHWMALLAALRDPQRVLLYHLENHYSLVYAARSWAATRNVADGVAARKSVCQILVGKPGQAPSRWIALEDVRACLLGWQGYAMMEVVRG